MRSPYGMELIDDCGACTLCSEGFFCRLPEAEMAAFQKITFPIVHPAGAVLFVEGQKCRGVYILCRGRVKLSGTSSDGATIIFKIAKPGEVLGLNSSIREIEHNMTAETAEPCQFNFIRQADFQEFLKRSDEAPLQVAIHLSRECHQAYHQIRSFTVHTGARRIARLLLDYFHGKSLAAASHGISVVMVLKQHEIGQIIGMSRETVSLTLSRFREQHIAEIHDSTLLIHDMAALEDLAS